MNRSPGWPKYPAADRSSRRMRAILGIVMGGRFLVTSSVSLGASSSLAGSAGLVERFRLKKRIPAIERARNVSSHSYI